MSLNINTEELLNYDEEVEIIEARKRFIDGYSIEIYGSDEAAKTQFKHDISILTKHLSVDDIFDLLPPVAKLDRTNRVEVIDENGRSYVNWHDDNNISVSMQDFGNTMKIFIDRKKSE